jgi:hypothetical protein
MEQLAKPAYKGKGAAEELESQAKTKPAGSPD